MIVTRGNVSKRTPVSSGRDPVWGSGAGAVLEFPVEAPAAERLRMRAMDQDELTEDDFLGDATLDVVAALENVKTFVIIQMLWEKFLPHRVPWTIGSNCPTWKQERSVLTWPGSRCRWIRQTTRHRRGRAIRGNI